MLSKHWPSEGIVTMEELQLTLDALEAAGMVRRKGEKYYATELGTQYLESAMPGALETA